MGYRRYDDVEADARSTKVVRVLWTVLGLNLTVAAAKLAYGQFVGSVAMSADGFHSLFDGLSNVVGLVGVSVARRPADESHPYGHGKYETWASVGIGLMLVAAAWSVGCEALDRLLGEAVHPDIGPLAFAVMGVTIVMNVGVTLWERRVGRRLSSEVLVADSEHTGSDVLVSLGVIGSLVAVRMGYEPADPIIALLVVAMILRAAWKVFKRAESSFSDRARIPAEAVTRAALSVDGVLATHDVRTRGAAGDVYVDLHVQVDPDSTLRDAHAVSEAVERRIADEFDTVVDVIAHVEPLDEYQSEKTDRQDGADFA